MGRGVVALCGEMGNVVLESGELLSLETCPEPQTWGPGMGMTGHAGQG